MKPTPQKIADLLLTLPDVTYAEPCTIAVKGTRYAAARYAQRCTVPPGCRAYTEGKRFYTQVAYYIAGGLPAVKRNGNVAFRIAGDSHDWYVASYYPAMNGRKQACMVAPSEFHPFGAIWLLHPWDIEDSKIDTYERVPYKRVNVDVVSAY